MPLSSLYLNLRQKERTCRIRKTVLSITKTTPNSCKRTRHLTRTTKFKEKLQTELLCLAARLSLTAKASQKTQAI